MDNGKKDHISIGRSTGLRICRILDPDSVGLNGAWQPYGRGIGSSVSSSGI